MKQEEAKKVVAAIAAGESFDVAVAIRALCVLAQSVALGDEAARPASSTPGGKKK